DTLPTGLAFVSGTGTSWTCSAVGQAVTCTSGAAIAAGATSPNPITLTVSVASTAVPAVNTFAPDNAQTGTPGTTIFYAHTFNAGSAGSVAFSTANVTTPAIAGWTQAIYRDSDCSGTLN